LGTAFLSSLQDCWDDCKTVDDVVSNEIVEDVCKDVVEPVCNTVYTRVCTENGVASPQTCPVVHLKPEWECANEAPSGEYCESRNLP
jgi:hypothetical protein